MPGLLVGHYYVILKPLGLHGSSSWRVSIQYDMVASLMD